MAQTKAIPFEVKLKITDRGDTPPLRAYIFSSGGKLLGSAPLLQGTAKLELPSDFDGRPAELVLGPDPEDGQPEPTAGALRRMRAHSRPIRILADKPVLDIALPSVVFPKWCLCYVRGRLVKRVTLPDGTVAERPVCNARVTICEVDRIPIVIEKLPELDLVRLRDDLLDKLRVIPRPPFPPRPQPDPPPFRAMASEQPELSQRRSLQLRSVPAAHFGGVQDPRVAALASASSVHHLRRHLVDLSDLIVIHICDLIYLWPFFRKDCLTTVEADGQGYFGTFIAYDCKDTPDLYFSVEQFSEGAWHSVYKPGTGCGTYWNYECGSEVVINLPGAVACEEPAYDVPPGVTQFVLPFAIGNTPIWGIPIDAPSAPDGWLRADGKVNYATGSPLGWLYDAPFGHTLNFLHDDSYFIPSSGIRYYRYSYRRWVPGNPANAGASDPTWTPISTPLARGYRMEYTDRLPTYESYPVGPRTIGDQTSLFEFKPQEPPGRPTDPSTVAIREWTSGNLSEVGASWDTVAAAPPLSDTNTGDDAATFEVKIEVFDDAGNQVMPGATTFRFLARNADNTTTRLATPAEEAGGAYVLKVHVDNNGSRAELPQPSIGGISASDDCGFLRYEPGDIVRIRYLADHPNDHAVFGFGITRGSNGLASASTTGSYVEVASATAPTGTTAYAKVGDFYQRDFTPADLVGSCVNAAFAASLSVYGKATNGYHRLGLDAHRLIAFALAETEDVD